MAINKEAINKLKSSLTINKYQSTFDFGSYEIEESVKLNIIEKESIIFNNFQKYSSAQYEICKALYEISLQLKQEGSFMAWYSHVGFGKDKISELLKRYELFLQFGDKREWISLLSTQAVKILTAKNIELEMLYDIAKLELKKVDEIKSYLDKNLEIVDKENIIIEEKEDEFIEEFKIIKNNIKALKNDDDFNKYKKYIFSLKKEIAALEEYFEEKALENTNKNNLKLEGLND